MTSLTRFFLMIHFHKVSFAAALTALTLASPMAFAEEATATDEAATTSAETMTGTVVETQSSKEMMRDALKANRDLRMEGRSTRATNRSVLRTLRRTEQSQDERGAQMRIKERQSARSLRRSIPQRLGSPNSGIRRTGIKQDALRVDTEETRQPVGRMRLFPGLFEN